MLSIVLGSTVKGPTVFGEPLGDPERRPLVVLEVSGKYIASTVEEVLAVALRGSPPWVTQGGPNKEARERPWASNVAPE